MTLDDFITAAQYQRGVADGLNAGLLFAIADRAAEDFDAHDLAASVRKLYARLAAEAIDEAKKCGDYDRGWCAGCATAVQTFDRAMTMAQLADCVTTVSSNLLRRMARQAA